MRASAMRQVIGRVFARFRTKRFRPSCCRSGSGVAFRFLGELHAGGKAEFGVDVREVG